MRRVTLHVSMFRGDRPAPRPLIVGTAAVNVLVRGGTTRTGPGLPHPVQSVGIAHISAPVSPPSIRREHRHSPRLGTLRRRTLRVAAYTRRVHGPRRLRSPSSSAATCLLLDPSLSFVLAGVQPQGLLAECWRSPPSQSSRVSCRLLQPRYGGMRAHARRKLPTTQHHMPAGCVSGVSSCSRRERLADTADNEGKRGSRLAVVKTVLSPKQWPAVQRSGEVHRNDPRRIATPGTTLTARGCRPRCA